MLATNRQEATGQRDLGANDVFAGIFLAAPIATYPVLQCFRKVIEMRVFGAAAVSLAFLALTASCSSATPARKPLRGALPVGTAEASVGDAGPTAINDVASKNGTLTVLALGVSGRGATIVMDTAGRLVAKGIVFTNVDGFTGSYWENAQGAARVDMVDQTYVFNGEARGFLTGDASRPIMRRFSVKAAC